MNSFPSRTSRMLSWLVRLQSSLQSTRWALMTVILSVTTITGCSIITHREVIYARVTRQKAETNGFMHLAQASVKVVVQGDATVRDFKPTAQTVDAGGYAVVLDDDLAKLVENTQVLGELAKDPALASAIKAAQAVVQARNAAP